jgi:hypothetical protein
MKKKAIKRIVIIIQDRDRTHVKNNEAVNELLSMFDSPKVLNKVVKILNKEAGYKRYSVR